MLKKSVLITFVLFIAITMWTGCAKVPVKQVEAAKQAIEEAKKIEVNRYFAEEFKAISDSLNNALAEIEIQNSKSAFSRNYKHGLELLNNVINDINTLTQKNNARKEEVKSQVEQKLVDLEAGVIEAKTLFQKAPRVKESKGLLDSIKTDIASVNITIDEIKTLINSGDFLTAKTNAFASYDKLESIRTDLEFIISKYTGKSQKGK